MSTHRVRSIGLHEQQVCARMRAMFREVRGANAEARRATEIAALPSKDWRGERVYRLLCEGPYGNGPHDQWKPERVLWALIDLGHYLCPFHQ